MFAHTNTHTHTFFPVDILIPVINSTFIANNGQSVDPVGLLGTVRVYFCTCITSQNGLIVPHVVCLLVGGDPCRYSDWYHHWDTVLGGGWVLLVLQMLWEMWGSQVTRYSRE